MLRRSRYYNREVAAENELGHKAKHFVGSLLSKLSTDS